jgi:hypothetical protein
MKPTSSRCPSLLKATARQLTQYEQSPSLRLIRNLNFCLPRCLDFHEVWKVATCRSHSPPILTVLEFSLPGDRVRNTFGIRRLDQTAFKRPKTRKRIARCERYLNVLLEKHIVYIWDTEEGPARALKLVCFQLKKLHFGQQGRGKTGDQLLVVPAVLPTNKTACML